MLKRHDWIKRYGKVKWGLKAYNIIKWGGFSARRVWYEWGYLIQFYCNIHQIGNEAVFPKKGLIKIFSHEIDIVFVDPNMKV